MATTTTAVVVFQQNVVLARYPVLRRCLGRAHNRSLARVFEIMIRNRIDAALAAVLAAEAAGQKFEIHIPARSTHVRNVFDDWDDVLAWAAGLLHPICHDLRLAAVRGLPPSYNHFRTVVVPELRQKHELVTVQVFARNYNRFQYGLEGLRFA